MLALRTDTFQRCLLSAKDDPSQCDAYRVELAKCSADAVPIVRETKASCRSQILHYDACLAHHRTDNDEELAQHCGPTLRELWKCTEQVKARLSREENEGQVVEGASMTLN